MTDSPGTPAPHGEALAPQRSQFTGAVTTLVAWVAVILPIILMAVTIFAEIMRPDQGMWTARNLSLMFLGALLLLCMIAFPQFLGNAVRFREKAMWRSAIITGIPTVAVMVYFIFRWMANLG